MRRHSTGGSYILITCLVVSFSIIIAFFAGAFKSTPLTSTPLTSTPTSTPKSIDKYQPQDGYYLSGVIGRTYSSLNDAITGCNESTACNGINKYNNVYTLRSGTNLLESNAKEISYPKTTNVLKKWTYKDKSYLADPLDNNGNIATNSNYYKDSDIETVNEKCKTISNCKGITYNPVENKWSMRSSGILVDSTSLEQSYKL